MPRRGTSCHIQQGRQPPQEEQQVKQFSIARVTFALGGRIRLQRHLVGATNKFRAGGMDKQNFLACLPPCADLLSCVPEGVSSTILTKEMAHSRGMSGAINVNVSLMGLMAKGVCTMSTHEYFEAPRESRSSRGPRSRLKLARSRDTTLQTPFALTVAARGWFRSSANSPK